MPPLLRILTMLCFLASFSSANAGEVTIFAAASTANALNEAAELFKSKTGHSMRASYAASSILAKQIEQGAPADLFLSADQQWMDYAVSRKMVDGRSIRLLLGNVMVLIAPSDSPINAVTLDKPQELLAALGTGRLATGDPDHVPVGIYARQAFQAAGLWDGLADRLARAESVRAALALVERGEAPLGLVYATDAAVSKKVKIVGRIAEKLHDPIIYPLALVSDRPNAASQALYDFLATPDAKGIFAKYGFKLN